MKKIIIAFVIGGVVGAAVSSRAQVNIDRTRYDNVRAVAKTLGLKAKNQNTTAAERNDLLAALAYLVVGEE